MVWRIVCQLGRDVFTNKDGCQPAERKWCKVQGTPITKHVGQAVVRRRTVGPDRLRCANQAQGCSGYLQKLPTFGKRIFALLGC